MEAIISYFEPYWKSLWEVTPTESLVIQTGLSSERVHEHIIAWLVIITLILVLITWFLVARLVCQHKRIIELEEVT